MIEKITYIESGQYDPYKNLALEEYLLLHCEKNECILYLWQNQNTIVIGRNQNAWKECRISQLEADNGHLVRRLSGGGTVYHDLGNLNFTFLVHKENYNLDKQLEVILRGIQKLGIHAEKSGRNDILADGRKFSGNAYYEQNGHCYHHGTLMVNVNLGELTKYLTVSKEKLQSKGVDSVKSRVANLTEFVPELTVEKLKSALKVAFEEVYGLKAKELNPEDLEQRKIQESYEKFRSWEWIYGRKFEFQYEISKRFPWGEVTLQFQVEDGRIKAVHAYSDSLKSDVIQELPKYLRTARYNNQAICTELSLYWSADKQCEEMMKDMIIWLQRVEL